MAMVYLCFFLEFIENRSAKMEFPCSETGHGGFIIACILSIFRLESVKRGDKGSSDKRMAAGRLLLHSKAIFEGGGLRQGASPEELQEPRFDPGGQPEGGTVYGVGGV